MYPLRFEPLFQRYLWGGRRLASTLGKPIGDQSAAESWEVVDHQDGQSVVANGPLAGKTLHELVVEFDADLVGSQVWQAIDRDGLATNLRLRFPLLLKFLDAERNLSVQVHPDDRLASKLDPPDLGKTEAWYVLDAEPGAKIYAGLKAGVDEATFRNAIESGTVESLLHSFEPQIGDCVFIEAGTMHAIGAGLLIAEIQQASNTTYRVFDWNRVDDQGNSRPLHIEQAMEATHFDRGPVHPSRPVEHSEVHQTLVECEQFRLDRWKVDTTTEWESDGRFRIIACVKGAVKIEGDPSDQPLSVGQTAMIPAAWHRRKLEPCEPDSEVLVIDVP